MANELAVRHPGDLDLKLWDNDQLLKRWEMAGDEIAFLQETAGRIEMELKRRIEEDGGTELSHPDYTVKIEEPYQLYLQPLLYTTKEYLTLVQWDRVYTPATTKPVPSKINMTILKSFRKFNRRIGEIIEAAKLALGPSKLQIKAKSAKRQDALDRETGELTAQ